MTEALLGFACIFGLALLRVPLAFAMGIVGIAGIGLTRGWQPAMASAAQVVYETGFAYTLSVIPLFILMGNFVARAGLAHELFQAAYAFIGHLRGGLAHATVAACAGFGAICGSSIATAATMSKVAYPSMKRMGYSDSLSTGVMAAGGKAGGAVTTGVGAAGLTAACWAEVGRCSRSAMRCMVFASKVWSFLLSRPCSSRSFSYWASLRPAVPTH